MSAEQEGTVGMYLRVRVSTKRAFDALREEFRRSQSEAFEDMWVISKEELPNRWGRDAREGKAR